MDFRSVEENLRHSFRLFATSRKLGEIREMPGVSIASAGVSFQMFNAAFLSEPVRSEQELSRRIALAAVHFGARGLGWSWWICEGWLERKVARRSAQLLRNHRLHLASELPGMVAERLRAPVRPLPAMDIRRVAGDSSWTPFCDIGSACFHVPAAWFREVFEAPGIWNNGFAGYVGYVGGKPVCTAATVVSHGVAGVYNVATLPDYQRKGCGEAIMRHALRQAREEHGVERSILQSTAQGFSLYQRMGYCTVTTVSVYNS